MINNCFEEDSDKFGGEIEVFEYPYKYFSNKSDNETIGFVVPDEHLNNSGSIGIFIVDFDIGNESLTESLQKRKQKKIVTLHKVYTPPLRNSHKQGKSIKIFTHQIARE